jgi:transcriptional regulator with XRE-family HTH domain
MTPEKAEDFLAWLDKELAERCLTDYKFAQLAHMSHSVVSDIRKGKIPNLDSMLKIAKALKVDDVFVLRLAGLISRPQDFDIDFELLKAAYVQVPKNRRPKAIKMIRLYSEEDES